MFFFFESRFTHITPSLQLYEAGLPEPIPAGTLHIQPGVQQLVRLELPDGAQLLLLGDPVFRPEEVQQADLLSLEGRLDLLHIYNLIRGHYNWFYLGREAFSCGNSFGALFPVYYQLVKGGVRISSSAFFLANRSEQTSPDRRYLLERLLFNYPLFGNTQFEGIRLLDAHSQLRITDAGMRVEKNFAIEQHFGSGRDGSRDAMARITGLFREESRLFLPDAPFAVSFTGGFDGRTLLAAARNAGRTDYFAYSFGMPEESDVRFPAAQASKLHIPYQAIYLDEAYVRDHALESAWAFLRLSGYNGNFGRPHYHYAAQLLSKQTGYLLTGNFGSELFRALHQPGVMMSEALIRIFSTPDATWKDYLRSQAAGVFREEMEALIGDLERFFDNMHGLSANERFYVFVFEEIFRKYFGPELVMQSHYLRNRTPYLSLPFFRTLNDTVWSGVHARLFEKQKARRLKGQIFYAAFLSKTDAQLYRLPTNKGYSPADVLETRRRPLLLGKVLLHKLFRRENGDSNAMQAWFERHRDMLSRQIQASEFHELPAAGINRVLERKQPADLEKSIHYFSVAAAWAAANRVCAPVPAP
jgi:asparagine synthase (glutamine-hydrolysing)